MATKILFTDYEDHSKAIELYSNLDNRIYIQILDDDPSPKWITLELDDAIKLVKHLKREIGYAKQNIEDNEQ